MAMACGGGKGQKAEINMRPMIDVLLVLIIIFMVITPVTQRGLEALVPKAPAADAGAAAPEHAIVISVGIDQRVRLNAEAMDLQTLQSRLEVLFRNRAAEVVFVRGDKGLEFQRVAEVLDLVKGAGVERVGLMTQ